MELDAQNITDSSENQELDTQQTEQTQTKQEEKPSFLDGFEAKTFSVNDVVDDLKDKDVQGNSNDIEDDIEDDFQDDFSENEFDDDYDKPNAPKPNAKKNASLITRWFDNAFAWLLAWWSGSSDFTLFKAEKKSLTIIEESLSEGFNSMEKDFKIPWWSGLMVEIPIAYSKPLKLAIQLRKKRKREEKQAKQRKNQNPNDATTMASFGKSTPYNRNNKDVVTDVEEYEEIDDLNGRNCKVCGTALRGRQKSTCSTECRNKLNKIRFQK